MTRQIKFLPLLVMPAVIVIGFITVAPQLRLRARIWAGELQAEAVPVVAFEAPAIPAKSRIVRLGCLTFRVPTPTGRQAVEVSKDAVFIEAGGVRALVFGPVKRDVMALPAEYLDLTRLPGDLACDPGALRTAAYAAGSQDLSIWMSPSEVDSLAALLEAKTLLCYTRATRVERISCPRLSGVLIIRESGDRAQRIQMLLEYFSPPDVVGSTGDAPMTGTAAMLVDAADPEAMNLARTIIASFAID
jgi:hypothetical protein